MAQKAKKLSLTQLKKEDAKRFNKTNRITVGNLYIDVNENLRETNTEAMTKEFIRLLLDEKDNPNIQDTDLANYLMHSLLFKYHTSLDDYPENCDVDTYLLVIKMLKDNGFYDKLIEEFEKKQDLREHIDKLSKQYEKLTSSELYKSIEKSVQGES